jgi:LacI family transcriptional regulator
MKSFLKNGSWISAIFAVNDNVAIGALRAVWEAGLRVPDNLAVIGYDDDEMGLFLPIPLTSVAQQKAEMGRLAITLLLERIQQGRRISRHICLEPELVVRASCGASTSSRKSVGERR